MDEQNYKQHLEMFSSILRQKLQIYREEKRRWDRFLSTDFNVVSEFIRPNENRLSDIIACLPESVLWIWYQYLKSANWNYADWTNKDTLIKMHTETDRVVEDIGNRLIEIIEVAKPEIEKWVQRNSSSQ